MSLLVVAAAIVSLTQGQVPAKEPSAGAILSRMMARYSGAKSMEGHIRASATAGADKVVVDTVFQFEKPSLVYIKQVENSNPPQTWVVASDGKHFSYGVPPYLDARANDRLIEAVNQNGLIQTCQDIYGASTESLKDRSMPLDVAFNRSTDLKFRRGQWASHAYLGADKIRGQDVSIVGGDWRAYQIADVGGKYKMWITDAGDLLRYEEDLTIGVPSAGGKGAMIIQRVATIWDVDIKINGDTDKSLYVLP